MGLLGRIAHDVLLMFTIMNAYKNKRVTGGIIIIGLYNNNNNNNYYYYYRYVCIIICRLLFTVLANM